MKQETPGWWVAHCLTAAAAAATRVIENRPKPIEYDETDDEETQNAKLTALVKRVKNRPPEYQSPAEAASAAFLCAMPPLVSRGHTTAFIACVAAGLGHRYLNALEAKSLMYSAQLALAAHRPRSARRGPPPTPRRDPSSEAAQILRSQNRNGHG